MSEEKEAIYKIAIEVGEIIGRYGTDKQIELFNKILEDYKIKNSGYFKLQKENQELKNKLKEIETIVDTRPYVAYTDYGDLLYESDEILEIIRGGESE